MRAVLRCYVSLTSVAAARFGKVPTFNALISVAAVRCRLAPPEVQLRAAWYIARLIVGVWIGRVSIPQVKRATSARLKS
jgi:hypothetical protein